VDKSRWDTSALRTNPLCGPIPLGYIRFADQSMLWTNPEGTNPFRTNPVGMYPLCGLIHFVDVSRRDQSRWDLSASRTCPLCGCIPKGPIPLGLIRFADLSTLWMYPEGKNPFRTNPKGTYPHSGLIHDVDVSRRDLSHREQIYFFIDFIIK
jgi:hypothetical protein